MKKVLLALTLMISSVLSAQTIAKSDSRNPWRENLETEVSKKFELSAEIAKTVVAIKERIYSQLIPLDMPNVETKMGKEQKEKLILSIRTKEYNDVQQVLNNDIKSKEIIAFLEGRIPLEKTNGRRR